MLKRVLPFFVTLAIGLFIASFFVDLAPTPFKFDRGMRRFREFQELKMENMELRNRCQQLQEQNEQLRSSQSMRDQIENWPKKNSVDTLPPPPPVRAVKAVK